MIEIVTRWFGVFAVDSGRVGERRVFPLEKSAILERWRIRDAGGLCEEERELLSQVRAKGRGEVTSRDRRFEAMGLAGSFRFLPRIDPRDHGFDPAWERELVYEHGMERLRASKDPSLGVSEAIRAITDMEAALNLIGERLGNWWVDEEPADLERVKGGPAGVAKQILASPATEGPGPGASPILATRMTLAQLYLDLKKAREEMEKAVEREATERFGNLSLVAGPLLAARLVAKAGGLERLARLPSSTVQVIGAERSFFDHLREGGPPPKYGLIFMHPAVLGAPTAMKGRVARTLAGRLSIAARRDLVGAPPLASLTEAVDRRTRGKPGPSVTSPSAN